MGDVLDRSHSIAKPGFNRWRVPPAALCIHLAIGEVYAFSVFNKPMASLVGGDPTAPGNWSIATLGWIFSVAIVFLGLSAAFGGKWVERVGPRKSMFTSALFFSGGLLVAGAGVAVHQLWLLIFGYGVLGGIGLGIGYISPVSTLIKWFPDRPGLATGVAIMGFGGGALIGAPLSVLLMKRYAASAPQGVSPTLLTMGFIYLVFMLIGAFIVRVPAPGWAPAGYVAPTVAKKLVTTGNVLVGDAMKTPQFYLLWAVLFLNVTAGIGVLGQASLMVQEMFPGHFPHATPAALATSAAAAAGFVGLLSIFNMFGRLFWASSSDSLGRKNTYSIFFVLGTIMYAIVPSLGRAHNLPLFVVAYAVIISMYGGGFATIPAYLKDLFGTVNVGAIHGRLLTAWAAAGVAGPVLINYIRQSQIASGVAKADAYSTTLYLMAALLVVGFFCNLAVRPLDSKFFTKRSVEPTRATA